MQKYFKCYYFKNAKELRPLASIIYMMFINRRTLSTSFGIKGIHGIRFYDPIAHDFYIVYSKSEILENIPCKTSPRSIARALNELDDKGFISRTHKEHYNRIQLPNADNLGTYKPRHAKVAASKAGCQVGTPQNAKMASQYKDTERRIFNNTCDTSHTETDENILKHNYQKELKQDKINQLIVKAKADHMQTTMNLPKPVTHALALIADGSTSELSKVTGMVLKAKKSEPKYFAKQHKHQTFTDQDLNQLANKLRFENNKFYENENGKRFAKKLITSIRLAQPQHNKRGTKVKTDQYIMRCLQNYFYDAILNFDPVAKDPNKHEPDIPLDAFDNDDSVAE